MATNLAPVHQANAAAHDSHPMRDERLHRLARTLYRRLMGVQPKKLETGIADVPLRLRDVLYYGYAKGFWPLVRGTCMRPRLRSSAGRFFLGHAARVFFPDRLTVGRNVAIGDYTYLNCYGTQGVILGNNVRIREFGWAQVTSHLTSPGLGIVVGDDTYIGPHSVLGGAGGIRIGRNVVLGNYVQLLAEDHAFADPDRPINEQGVTKKGISIEEDCWLGNNVIVLDGVTIGRGSVVGAGAVVTKDIPSRSVAVGNPARVIRSR